MLTGQFAFIEASYHNGKSSWLTSPKLVESTCLSFWYYMYVVPSAELNVYINNTNDGLLRKVWSLSGDQEREWRQATVPLLTHSKSYKVYYNINNNK